MEKINKLLLEWVNITHKTSYRKLPYMAEVQENAGKFFIDIINKYKEWTNELKNIWIKVKKDIIIDNISQIKLSDYRSVEYKWLINHLFKNTKFYLEQLRQNI